MLGECECNDLTERLNKAWNHHAPSSIERILNRRHFAPRGLYFSISTFGGPYVSTWALSGLEPAYNGMRAVLRDIFVRYYNQITPLQLSYEVLQYERLSAARELWDRLVARGDFAYEPKVVD